MSEDDKAVDFSYYYILALLCHILLQPLKVGWGHNTNTKNIFKRSHKSIFFGIYKSIFVLFLSLELNDIIQN